MEYHHPHVLSTERYPTGFFGAYYFNVCRVRFNTQSTTPRFINECNNLELLINIYSLLFFF